MRQADIEVGKTYYGKTGLQRQVYDLIDIGKYKGDSVDVLYTHESGRLKGNTGRMWLPYFAQWAKGLVEGEGNE